MRAAGEVHDTEYQELRRRHAPTSAQSARTRSALLNKFNRLGSLTCGLEHMSIPVLTTVSTPNPMRG
jgi:hypothetical protein